MSLWMTHNLYRHLKNPLSDAFPFSVEEARFVDICGCKHRHLPYLLGSSMSFCKVGPLASISAQPAAGLIVPTGTTAAGREGLVLWFLSINVWIKI